MKKTFKIATLGIADSQGDIIMYGAVKEKSVILLDEFDNSKPLGHVEVREVGQSLFATGEISPEYLSKIPAIGFTIINAEKDGHKRIIHEMNLYCVGLGDKPNIDNSIKPINQQ